MIIEVSIAVIAAAFVVLVIYLALTMKHINATLHEINRILPEGRRQLFDLANEAKKMIKHGDRLSLDIDEKINAFTPLCKTIESLGAVFERKTSPLINTDSEKMESFAGTKKYTFYKKKKNNLTEEEEENNGSEKLAGIVKDFIEITAIGIRLWQNIKKER